MMLTRSPIVAASTNASSPRGSFHNFGGHYASASAPSPRPSSSSPCSSWVQVPAIAKSLRQPSTSSPAIAPIAPKSPQPQPPSPTKERYVAVDAATQYSPMEPMDYVTGAIVPRHHPSAETQTESNPQPSSSSPPPPAPTSIAEEQNNININNSMAVPGDGLAAATAVTVTVSHVDAQATTPPGPSTTKHHSIPHSPSKRRNSQGPGDNAGTTPAGAGQNPSGTATKRVKPEQAPPKILPERYEFCQVEDMVVLIAHMLGELIETNDALALKSGHLTRFHSRTAPGISVLDYLHRLAKHATLTPPLLLSMVYYIDRLCALYPEFTINTLTVHRFLITAATVAAKGLSDAFWNNSTYARVGGVRVAELKLLELEFLYRVDWKIVPNPEVLVAYYRGLVDRCPGYSLQPPKKEDKTPEQQSRNEGDQDDEDDEEDSDVIDDDYEDDDVDEDGSGEAEGMAGPS